MSVVDASAMLADGVSVSPGAVVGAGAKLGAGAEIGANAVIGEAVEIGERTRIGAGASVSHAIIGARVFLYPGVRRSEEHTSELQSLMRISYAVFCLKKKKK